MLFLVVQMWHIHYRGFMLRRGPNYDKYKVLIVPFVKVFANQISAGLNQISMKTGIILPTLFGYLRAKKAEPLNIYKIACFFYSEPDLDALRRDNNDFEEFFENYSHVCKPGRSIPRYWEFDFSDNTCSFFDIVKEVSPTETDQTLADRSGTSLVTMHEVRQRGMNLEFYALNKMLISFYDNLGWREFTLFMNNKGIYDMFTTFYNRHFLEIKRKYPSICFSQAKDFLKDYSDPLLFE